MEVNKINFDELKIIAGDKGFSPVMIEKDYLVTYLLYLIKDVKDIYFKGGTALNKIFLNHERLSEDLDFSLTRDVKSVVEDIKKKLQGTFFDKVTKDKDVEGFTRLIVHYKLFHENGTIFIDLNERANILCKPEEHEVKHFYNEFLPKYSVKTLAKEEMIAEKIAAAINRNRPRDHFDIYTMIKHKLSINMDLVREKCTQSGTEFNIIKMFSNAKKLKNRWDKDMSYLMPEPISFIEVMQTLSKYFKLKEEKEKLKNKS
ncbi:MAG: nucleotidyl transferase AbiEii/AbiGii toxin family protein [Nanoarchaeota archaeon]|nr:nucleotidyl transferase AbiEii/AbiGii toxin family protein [Nanoarchaeota archaeon]MBU1051104.1 nucleotidyl transferase AbiEii/AbiGii toxin family protein [Nanoarchaeota archaeon]MBU1987960.1 nucleotidyl transferase AbiEii/AbiGii toxin family protein [Nanoarchaeota archaeon]